MFLSFLLLTASNLLFAASHQGSYNSFVNQVGFCKQQGFDTVSRATSQGPPMFLAQRVMIGVGLSNDMFADSMSSCGRCLEITSLENFWAFDETLTHYSYKEPWPVNVSFIAMVMDQCKDPVCRDGYLDFDVYSHDQPTRFGNPQNIEWTFVDCPVGQEPLELLLCLGPRTCQEDDPETRTVQQVWQDAAQSSYFTMYIRNARVPVVAVDMVLADGARVPLEDNQSWQWSYPETGSFLAQETWTFLFTTADKRAVEVAVDWYPFVVHPDQCTTPGYRGGLVYTTDVQV